MEHIAAFMILIACSEGLSACSEQPAPATAFESMQQCEMDLSPSIRMRAGDASRTFGRCIEIDPALLYEDAEIVWDVTEERGLEVTVELINPEMNIRSIAQAPSSGPEIRLN
ncbi:MAG: hypothetical protein RIA09_09585 [Hoeflea sp.]|uniref:hypothetical protein n=1 Tax=Hoeflea sp. TaxID=1940281 RepID=UPI0032EF0E4C